MTRPFAYLALFAAVCVVFRWWYVTFEGWRRERRPPSYVQNLAEYRDEQWRDGA